MVIGVFWLCTGLMIPYQTFPTDSTDPHVAQPERPTVATHAGTVAPDWIEIEMGGQGVITNGETALQSPVVLKMGLASRVQLSVFLNSAVTAGPRVPRTDGIADAALGIKWRILEDAPVLGDFAILPTITLPTGSPGVTTGTTGVGLLLISSHELGPVSLDINAGYTHRSGSGTRLARAATLWTISAGVPVIGALGWVGEISGLPGTGGPSGQAPIVACLTGPTWTVRKYLVFDAGISPTLRGPQPPYAYAGVTWNIGRI